MNMLNEQLVIGDIKVNVQTAQVVSDFLLVLLKLADSPLTGDQIKEFSAFRELVKAGPVEEVLTGRNRVSTLADGIVIGNGPKMLIDRHLSVKFLRGLISGELTDDLKSSYGVALVDAIAKKGPKVNTGINGRFCQGTFGYAVAQEAKDYLCGRTHTVSVSRGKSKLSIMPVYFADAPNSFIEGAKDWATGTYPETTE